MVIDVLRLDDYFKRKKKRSSMKFHCYYWRYGQVGMPELGFDKRERVMI